jgi:hypothetical protein
MKTRNNFFVSFSPDSADRWKSWLGKSSIGQTLNGRILSYDINLTAAQPYITILTTHLIKDRAWNPNWRD